MSWIFSNKSHDDEDDDESYYTDDEDNDETDDSMSHDSDYSKEDEDEGTGQHSERKKDQDEEAKEMDIDQNGVTQSTMGGSTDKIDDSLESAEFLSNTDSDGDVVLVGQEDLDEETNHGLGTVNQRHCATENLQESVSEDDVDFETHDVPNDEQANDDHGTVDSETSEESVEEEDTDSDDDEEVDEIIVETVESEGDIDEEMEDDDEEEEEVTSFWEKQSLLVLAAEHDRVDILKAILTNDDQEETSALMNSGIPPLHIAITFGSTNATQSLLRMGADPSIRPHVAKIKEQQKLQPEGSKVEIPNMGRFDGVTAWELAFGAGSYADGDSQPKARWSFFGSPKHDETDSNGNDEKISSGKKTRRNIKPVDMAPSKREGIRHAFTAEALRCIGGDEVERLRQLVDSGMPPTIDLGGKDLYGWAVEMGAMQCEELLRPAEAAKHASEDATISPNDTPDLKHPDADARNDDIGMSISGAILDRSQPGDDSTPRLINRLDELEALARALSTCLDSLAEEVSVCHGLLLMGGGASALASHVRSLKTLKQQKLDKLKEVEEEWDRSEDELSVLIKVADDAGRQFKNIAPTKLLLNGSDTKAYTMTRSTSFRTPAESPEEEESQRRQLNAQIAASENKVRKLRASIADLSEESARDLEEVERRGLSGGINLVRAIREELRDIEFQLSEANSMNATCRAKISWIHSQLNSSKAIPSSPVHTEAGESIHEQQAGLPSGEKDEGNHICRGFSGASENESSTSTPSALKKHQEDDIDNSVSQNTSGDEKLPLQKDYARDEIITKPHPNKSPVAGISPHEVSSESKDMPSGSSSEDTTVAESTPQSVRISTGDSNAIALRPTGNRGYSPINLWQVLLRIMGLDGGSGRRSADTVHHEIIRQGAANLMIV